MGYDYMEFARQQARDDHERYGESNAHRDAQARHIRSDHPLYNAYMQERERLREEERGRRY